MKKLLLMLLCLFVVSVFATTAFASSDVGNISNNDSIQLSDNHNGDISIPVNMTSPDNTDPSETISADFDANQTI